MQNTRVRESTAREALYNWSTMRLAGRTGECRGDSHLQPTGVIKHFSWSVLKPRSRHLLDLCDYCMPCACVPSLSLLMTVPSVKRLLLIDAPSFMRKPSAPVLAMRSEPAKSTRVRVDTQTAPPSSDSALWSLLRLSTTYMHGTIFAPLASQCFS